MSNILVPVSRYPGKANEDNYNPSSKKKKKITEMRRRFTNNFNGIKIDDISRPRKCLRGRTTLSYYKT